MELFKSTSEALFFAYNYSTQQYALSPMAKMVISGIMPSGKGLVSTDGAAQAGLILAAVERLGKANPLYKACIVARYSPKFAECKCCGNQEMLLEEYKLAVTSLQHATAQTGVVTGLTHSLMRESIVRLFYEKGLSLQKTADRMHIPKRTAYDQKDKIWKWLKEVDNQAQLWVDDLLYPLISSDN